MSLPRGKEKSGNSINDLVCVPITLPQPEKAVLLTSQVHDSSSGLGVSCHLGLVVTLHITVNISQGEIIFKESLSTDKL